MRARMIVGRRLPPGSREPGFERAFTLVEMLVTVTIMGIVMFALCGALMAGVSAAPETGGRTRAAVDASFLADRLSDDIANAKTIEPAPPLGTNTLDCAPSPDVESIELAMATWRSVLPPEVSEPFLASFWPNGAAVTVGGNVHSLGSLGEVTITSINGDVVKYYGVLEAYDVDHLRVTVVREGPVGTYDTVYSGYCPKTGAHSTNVAQVTVSGNRFEWTLDLAPTTKAPSQIVRIGGDRRTV